MNNIYSNHKIMHHADVLSNLKQGIQTNPIQVHLMPQNKCNHRCEFCSYRLDENKNNQLFDCSSHIPEKIMAQLLSDCNMMGIKAIEITGGGEPLLYPHKELMFQRIIDYGFDYGLVTNGTLLTDKLAKMAVPKMTWARVSIDAGSAKSYAKIRRVPESHFEKAFNSIRLLRKYAANPQFKLGVGFVVNNDNYTEIFDSCKKAKENGADNVRISAIFHPDGMSYFDEGVIEYAKGLAKLSETLTDETFKVYNLFDERIHNLEIGRQNYKYCGTKDVLCVIGGDCTVYTCCSLAFNKKGLIGSIKDQTFKQLWASDEKRKMFEEFDASKICTYGCLYENKNKFMNSLLSDPLHVNFI